MLEDKKYMYMTIYLKNEQATRSITAHTLHALKK